MKQTEPAARPKRGPGRPPQAPAVPPPSTADLRTFEVIAQHWRENPDSIRPWILDALAVQVQALHQRACVDTTQTGILAHRAFVDASAVVLDRAGMGPLPKAPERRSKAGKVGSAALLQQH